MNRKYLAFLVLTFLTFFVLNLTKSNATCNACSLDVTYPPVSFIYPMFEYDSGIDDYCTIYIHTTLRRYKCGANGPYYDEYEITKIEVYGYCTLSSTEIMKMAIKGIAALKNLYNQPVNYIRMPKCLYRSSTSPDVYESCDNVSCCIYFESHWDSTNADYYLDSISIDAQFGCIGIYPSCENYCNESILPETGRLNISANMPPACFSTCSRYESWPQPYIQHYFMDGTYINGLYTLGSSGSTPCFSFNVIQVKYNYMAPENAFEKLIKIALHQIYHTQGQPQYITLNLWKCWNAPYSPQQTYFPCSNTDCCEITFEMLYNGTQAQVYSRNTPNEECQGTCVDVCDIFDNNPFMLPKYSLEFDELNLGENIKINPNPNIGTFELEYWTNISDSHTIQVVDMLGNIIFTANYESHIGNNKHHIDLTKIASGIYYLHIVNKGLTTHKIKFIKN